MVSIRLRMALGFFSLKSVAGRSSQPPLQIRHDRILPGRKSPRLDLPPGLAHQPQVETQVVQTGDLGAQVLLAVYEVTQVGLGVELTRQTRILLIDGAEILLPLGVLDVDDAAAGVEQAVAGVSGGQHAVEHIDAEGNALQDIDRRAYAHQVAGLIFGQDLTDQIGHLVHIFRRFAYRQAADGVGLAAETRDGFRGGSPQIGVGAALHDGEERLKIAVEAFLPVEVIAAAPQPAVGHLHRVFGVAIVARVGRAFVKGHDDIAADGSLDIDRLFRREKVAGAVDVRLKGNAFLFDLPVVT